MLQLELRLESRPELPLEVPQLGPLPERPLPEEPLPVEPQLMVPLPVRLQREELQLGRHQLERLLLERAPPVGRPLEAPRRLQVQRRPLSVLLQAELLLAAPPPVRAARVSLPLEVL